MLHPVLSHFHGTENLFWISAYHSLNPINFLFAMAVHPHPEHNNGLDSNPAFENIQHPLQNVSNVFVEQLFYPSAADPGC